LRLILQKGQPWLRYLGIAVFSGLLLLSLYKNSWEGSQFLNTTYQEAAPMIRFLGDRPESVVAVSHQFVGQTFEATTHGQKYWFIAETPEQLQQLSQTLHQENINQFLYICYPHRECPLPQQPGLTINVDGSIYRIQLNVLKPQGIYSVYQGLISPKS
jgi:hypothetical protein